MAIYHMMSEQDVITALKFPWTSIGSDAGASLNPNAVDTLKPCSPTRLWQLPSPHRTFAKARADTPSRPFAK